MSKILLLSHIFPPSIDGGSRVIHKLGQYFESQNYQTLYLSSDCSSTDDFVNKTPLSSCLPAHKVGHLPLKKERHSPLIFQGRGLRDGFLKLPVYRNLRRPLKFINLFIPKKFYLHQLFQVFQKGPVFKIIPFAKATIKIIRFQPDYIIAGPLPTTIILYAKFYKNVINIFNKINNFPSFRQRRGLRGRFCKLLINASFHPTDPDFLLSPLIKTLQSADFIWTLTQFESDYFIKKFNINPSKIILAGNGVDSNFLLNPLNKLIPCPVKGRDREGFSLLFIGSLSAHKGVDLLINSFSNLYNKKIISSLNQGRMPRFVGEVGLVIAGQKTLFYPQIKKIVDQLPKTIKSKIKFIYNFPQSKLAELIDNCDLLILPSSQESFGLVLIEAWARSKPVIVSDIPSLSEMIQKTHGGLTFKLKDSSDLTKKILQLINSPQLMTQLGQNGFNYVKNNYLWSIVGKKIWQKIS